MSASTTHLRPPADALRTTTVFGRSIAAEWTRLWSVRSTWWSIFAAAGFMLFVGIAFGLDMNEPTPVWVAGELGIVFAQFALMIPAMLAVTSEYSTGAIRSTLQGVPRRGVLGLSRLAVTVGVATAVATVLLLAADVASSLAMGPHAELVVGDVAASIGACAIVVASGTWFVVGIGTILRSSAGTLTTAFLLLLVLPLLLPSFGVAWLATVGEHLPGSATLALMDAFGDPVMGTLRAAAVLGAWLLAVTVAGGWLLLRRDAA